MRVFGQFGIGRRLVLFLFCLHVFRCECEGRGIRNFDPPVDLTLRSNPYITRAVFFWHQSILLLVINLAASAHVAVAADSAAGLQHLQHSLPSQQKAKEKKNEQVIQCYKQLNRNRLVPSSCADTRMQT